MFMKRHALIPWLIFSLVALVYAFPILEKISYWGYSDWDQFTFWNAVPRETILRYHQFPLWNPYANGGNVMLAHPDSPFLSPFYVFVLLFGPVLGLKLEIIIHLIAGLGGMFLLSQYMGMGSRSSYFAAFVYMLSSVYAMHLTEGQMEWLALAFVPWVFLYYLKGIKETRWVLGAIFFLGSILIGGVYVFNLFIVFLSIYAVLKALQLKQLAPIKTLIFILAGTFLLCSIKLFPILEFFSQYPRITHEMSGVDLASLSQMLLSRQQALLDMRLWDTTIKNGELVHGWHEYGAYIGIIPLLLFLWGAVKRFFTDWPFLLAGLIALFIAFGRKFPINLWGVLKSLPVYGSLTVPSRFMFCFIFCVAILSGFGLSCFEQRNLAIHKYWNPAAAKSLTVIVVLVVLFDLWQVNSPIFRHAFGIPPMRVTKSAFFAQRYRGINYYEKKVSRSSQYPIFLSNSGILGAYEVVYIKRGKVRIISDPDYRGEVYLDKSYGKVTMKYFSPNKIIVDVDAKQDDILVVNQNYYRGWRVKKEKKTLHAASYKGLIAASVSRGRQRIIFYYMPFSFLAGFCVTLSFLSVVAVFYRKQLGMSKFSEKLSK